MTDYYNELGVGKTATSTEIKKAYKRLASKYHPDKNSTPGAEEQFKRIKEAYETLSNDEKRKAYDNPGWQPHQFENFDTHDIFTQFRHSQARQQQTRKPTYTVKISLNQSYTGTVVQITDQSVRVPRGVRTGNKLFMDKFFVEIHIVPHHKFKRSQDDLLFDVSISAIEAMLGIEVILEHIDGNKLKFKINEGIQPGQIMKLKGKGMPNPETDRYGDLLVRVNITIPRLTNDEKRSIMHIQNRKSIEQ